ncbi:hypothetical protein QYF36_018126 [Acer negundo]|nr:hypothetical protein QYF36_018126 [Acer negundo]
MRAFKATKLSSISHSRASIPGNGVSSLTKHFTTSHRESKSKDSDRAHLREFLHGKCKSEIAAMELHGFSSLSSKMAMPSSSSSSHHERFLSSSSFFSTRVGVGQSNVSISGVQLGSLTIPEENVQHLNDM